MIYLPIIGAIILGLAMITERKILSKDNINIWLCIFMKFFFVVLISSPFIYFLWDVQERAFSFYGISIFLVIVIFSFIANYFVTSSFKGDDVNHLEPARATEPLFIIIFSLIFSFVFGEGLYERNANVFIPALIAGITLVLSHLHKGHIVFNKYFLFAGLGSLFFGLEMVLTRLVLEIYSPFSLYFLRGLFLAVLTFVFFKPQISKTDKNSLDLFFILGILVLIFRLVVYYGYLYLGVVFTTLLIMLGPVFVYLFAYFILKEKMSWSDFVSSLVIVGAIGYVLIF